MKRLYFKQPYITAEKASKIMEKHFLGQGEKVIRLNPFKIRLSTGSLLWKGNVDIEFSKKEDHLVIKVDKKLLSGALKSGISMMRSGKVAQKIENVARYLFEEVIKPEESN